MAKRRDDVSEADRRRAQEEYGDVEYADPTNKKYPIDTEEHIRAAWNYIHQEKNAAKYDPKEVCQIKKRIVAAWKRVIDKEGPPGLKEDPCFKKGKGLSFEEIRERLFQRVYEVFPGNEADRTWIVEVYPEYAIIRRGDTFFRAPYAVDGNEVTVAGPEEWQEVEKEWQPVSGKYLFTVKAISSGDESMTIGGYGIVFTGPEQKDLQGDYFAPDTELWLDFYGEVPLLYHHAQDGVLSRRVLGKARAVRKDEVGVWYEAQLGLRDAYEQMVAEMVRKGKLGYSTGSVPHLVERERDGKLTSWPPVEISLTPAPAAGPYLTSVDEVRSAFKSVGLEWPEDEEEEGAGAGPAPAETKSNEEEKEMEQKDIEKLVEERVQKALEEFAAKTAEPKAKAMTGESVPVTARPEYRSAFVSYVRRRSAAVKLLQEGSDAAGGYLVPDDYQTILLQARQEAAVIRKLVPAAHQWKTSRDKLVLPKLVGTLSAGATSEGGAYHEETGEDLFGELTLEPWKYTLLVKVSEELLEDSAIDVVQVLAQLFGQAYARLEDTKFVTGTGTNEPQGVLTAAGVGVTAAATDAITADEIIDLYYSLGGQYRGNAVWLANDATIGYIRKLKDSNNQYLWMPGLRDGQPDMLLGRPIYAQNDMPTMEAEAKVLLFGDFTFYEICDNTRIGMKRLNERFADEGKIGFASRIRVDGRVSFAEAFKVLQMAAA